ncbi:nitrogenase cofactor biosynthesis protein NifB [Celerinatantimonas sp. YJH-8]|uniref:nitrogenase cofactor biosynthesis protein NifB n=1 Tax=Celerinatantimonas sp. YJH-8 TaxID=3228714 RepID=UPI0038C1D28A
MESCHQSCQSGQSTSTFPRSVMEQVANHPCYSTTGSHRFARMHLAVAPACNIQCNYCNRKFDCSNESRPGVVSELLSPTQALRKAKYVASKIPQLSVIGIAGPGDPLANPHKTFRTLELLRQEMPDIRLCLSTNGLALPDLIPRIIDVGVEHVTITINTLDAYLAADIYEWVIFNGRKYRGVEAGQLLIDRQMEGLRKLLEHKVLVKVNSVLIPRINRDHLPVLSQELFRNQVFLHNVMPLIAKPEHGTVFGLNQEAEPTAEQLEDVRQKCGHNVAQMRHCQQCRADAIGMLGEDRSQQFNLNQLPEEETDYLPVMQKRAQIQADLVSAGAASEDNAYLVAVASDNGEQINQHFGHAKSFMIYSVGDEGVHFVQRRQVPQYCDGSEHCDDDESKMDTFTLLADIDAVFCCRIGLSPWEKLEQQKCEPVIDYAWQSIYESLKAWWEMKPHETLDQCQAG